MRKFIGRNTIQALSMIFKKELHGKVSDKDEFTSDDTLRIYNSITEKDIPNLGSLVHNHDERYALLNHNHNELYYTQTQIDTVINEIKTKVFSPEWEVLQLLEVPDTIDVIRSHGIRVGKLREIVIQFRKKDLSTFSDTRTRLGRLPVDYVRGSNFSRIVSGSVNPGSHVNRSIAVVIQNGGQIELDIDAEATKLCKDIFIDFTYFVN